MSFVEFKTTRTKKSPEELEAGKTWQPNARRLYIPLEPKKYGLTIKDWKDAGGKPHHSITWKHKPYAKLLLNSDRRATAILQLKINTSDGIAIQVDPANHERFYISIPKGALANLPATSCNLAIESKENTHTYSKI